MIKKTVTGLFVFFLLLVAIYLAGPTPPKPLLQLKMPQLGERLDDIEKSIEKREKSLKLKPDNHSRIIWSKPEHKEPTEYAILYLHGFSASPQEAEPMHTGFAKKYGANLYLPRLEAHGLQDENAFLNLDVDNYLQSAADALAVAKKLGKKVIVMGCSTGATLGLYLAAEFPDDVHSLMLYSPNVELSDPASALLTMPWGKHIARQVLGSDFREIETVGDEKKYWYEKYRIEGLITLKQLIQTTMTEATFQKIKQPLFVAYYYKNEQEHDPTISIPAMEKMFDSVQTPTELKRKKAFPNARVHALVSRYTSGCLEELNAENCRFAEEILQLKARTQN
ncbi:MAG: alpha/beta hydrolase [Cytophagales bacterium]|nr:alpha/beta hydrolase [Cytophagales bacterium]